MGEIHRTPRNKPKLRAEAIPCINLPSNIEIAYPGEEDLSGRGEQIEILSQKDVAEAKRKLPAEKRKLPPEAGTKFVIPKKVKIIYPVLPKPPQKQALVVPEVEEVDIPNPETDMCTENSEEKLTMFETLYDEAFDVTLPSLLWGIHRDPERKFIAFSKFDAAKMTISKLMHISDKFHCTTHVNSERWTSKILNLEQLAVEHVSTILDELDKEAAT